MNQPISALLIIDVQQGLFRKSTPIYQAETLLQNIQSLVARARLAATPVIYIQHDSTKVLIKDTDDWQLHPSLEPLETEPIIYKQHGSAFEQTGLHDELQKRGIKKVVLCGLVTHGCVRATCLDALKLGYQVILVSDAHSNYSKDAERFIAIWNVKLAKQGAELNTTAEVFF